MAKLICSLDRRYVRPIYCIRSVQFDRVVFYFPRKSAIETRLPAAAKAAKLNRDVYILFTIFCFRSAICIRLTSFIGFTCWTLHNEDSMCYDEIHHVLVLLFVVRIFFCKQRIRAFVCFGYHNECTMHR